MLPLFGGAVILGCVIIFGIRAATSLLIERQILFALADSAALAGAERVDPAKLSLTSSGIQAPLESGSVAAAGQNFLTRADSAGLESLLLEAAHTPEGRHAEVRLSSMWAPPVVSDFFPASLRITPPLGRKS
jgi:hypothetical protein